jgi:transposase
MVTDYGFSGGFQTVQRFVRKLKGSQGREPAGIILTAAGEECQVDYGTGPLVRDAQLGKYRRTRLFVLTLGYSRKSVRLLVFRSSTRTWAELHETAFRRLGGSPRVVVLDNLKEGVLSPDIYDPILNPLFKDVLAHYGVVAMPCRVRDPDRKGKVESGVGHAQKTPLKGLRFESFQEAQSYLNWELRWADTRIHGTTKRQVAAMFAEEKPLLLPLPIEPFRYYQPNTVNAWCIWMGAWKSKRRITAFRRIESESSSMFNGIRFMSAFSIRNRINCYVSTFVSSAAGIAFTVEIIRRRHLSQPCSCWRARNVPARRLAHSVKPSISIKESLVAVTAMLDRLLHHGHVLKCGPRSWRTKTQLPETPSDEKTK